MPGSYGAVRREGGDKYPYFRYILKVGPAGFLERLVFE